MTLAAEAMRLSVGPRDQRDLAAAAQMVSVESPRTLPALHMHAHSCAASTVNFLDVHGRFPTNALLCQPSAQRVSSPRFPRFSTPLQVLEEVAVELVRSHLFDGADGIVIVGGCALNVRANSAVQVYPTNKAYEAQKEH